MRKQYMQTGVSERSENTFLRDIQSESGSNLDKDKLIGDENTINSEDIEFTGIFFNRNEFYRECDRLNIGVRLASCVRNPHVTVKYKPDILHKELFGQKAVFRAIGYANDGVNEGFKVELVSAGKDLEELVKEVPIPHITISFGKSAKAVNTRYLDFKPIKPVEFEGVFGGRTYNDKIINTNYSRK